MNYKKSVTKCIS